MATIIHTLHMYSMIDGATCVGDTLRLYECKRMCTLHFQTDWYGQWNVPTYLVHLPQNNMDLTYTAWENITKLSCFLPMYHIVLDGAQWEWLCMYRRTQ